MLQYLEHIPHVENIKTFSHFESFGKSYLNVVREKLQPLSAILFFFYSEFFFQSLSSLLAIGNEHNDTLPPPTGTACSSSLAEKKSSSNLYVIKKLNKYTEISIIRIIRLNSTFRGYFYPSLLENLVDNLVFILSSLT